MNKSWFSVLPLSLLLTALLCSCHKPEGLKTQSTYSFINQTGKRITFDIYRNKADYDLQQNLLHQYIIEPNASQPIVLDVAMAYWIDWYSAGLSNNNWQSNRSSYNRSSPPPEMNIAAEDQEILIKAATLDTARSVLLGGSGVSSRWRCTISDNPQLNGTHEFIFSKDFSCTYIYTNTGGNSTQIIVEYIINASTTTPGVPQGFTAYILNTQGSVSYRLTCNTGFLISPHTGRDSMLIRFQQTSGAPEYPMVRQ